MAFTLAARRGGDGALDCLSARTNGFISPKRRSRPRPGAAVGVLGEAIGAEEAPLELVELEEGLQVPPRLTLTLVFGGRAVMVLLLRMPIAMMPVLMRNMMIDVDDGDRVDDAGACNDVKYSDKIEILVVWVLRTSVMPMILKIFLSAMIVAGVVMAQRVLGF